MGKKLDLKKTVFELTEEYPELIKILKEAGFVGVAHPFARSTLGKVTTIPEGCKRMGKDMNEVINLLLERGFEIESGQR